jgi:hypothetical protein
MKFLSPETNGDCTYYYRNYSRIDTTLLMHDVASLDWSTIYSTPNVVEQVAFFNVAISQLFDGHVPLRRGCWKSNFNQWFNSEIEMAIVNRNLGYPVNALVRQAKRSYMN